MGKSDLIVILGLIGVGLTLLGSFAALITGQYNHVISTGTFILGADIGIIGIFKARIL